jgi:hypothetical protein
MNSLIHDIINDPGEYLPMLLLFAGLLIFWAALCWSGFASVRASTPRRRLWFAAAPILFGLIAVWSHIPFSAEGDGYKFSFDFRWIFFVPLLFGVVGGYLWCKTKQQPSNDETTTP